MLSEIKLPVFLPLYSVHLNHCLHFSNSSVTIVKEAMVSPWTFTTALWLSICFHSCLSRSPGAIVNLSKTIFFSPLPFSKLSRKGFLGFFFFNIYVCLLQWKQTDLPYNMVYLLLSHLGLPNISTFSPSSNLLTLFQLLWLLFISYNSQDNSSLRVLFWSSSPPNIHVVKFTSF